MPLQQYEIIPNKVSNGFVPENELSVLECTSNMTLANLIRQLGSLSDQSSQIFENLNIDAKNILDRTKILNGRLENLKDKCSKLDYKTESSTKFENYYDAKLYKSPVNFDQKMFSKESMSERMRMLYDNADPPPQLSQFNKYWYNLNIRFKKPSILKRTFLTKRDNDVDALKMYSDPSFFFNFWISGLIQENEDRRMKRKQQKVK